MTTTIHQAIANILNAQGFDAQAVDALPMGIFLEDYLRAEMNARKAACAGLFSESEQAQGEADVQAFCNEYGIDRAEIYPQ